MVSMLLWLVPQLTLVHILGTLTALQVVGCQLFSVQTFEICKEKILRRVMSRFAWDAPLMVLEVLQH